MKGLQKFRQRPRAERLRIGFLLIALGMIVLFVGNMVKPSTPPPTRANLSLLEAQITAHQVKQATLNDAKQEALVVLVNGKQETVAYPFAYSGTLTGQLIHAKAAVRETPAVVPNLLQTLLVSALPQLLLLALLGWYMLRKGGMRSFFRGSDGPLPIPETRFRDVAGLEEVVDELSDAVQFLKDPKRFAAAGARMPRGFLLEGPPGTGKTMLAKAVAGEAGVPCFTMAGSDFAEMFVGLGARRVRSLFAQAAKAGKAVIFIDEIDALGRARGAASSDGMVEREVTLNALLVAMDGFTESTGTLVIAATNQGNLLDPALLRPGRFDRRVSVPAPSRQGREQLLALYARKHKVTDDVDFAALARRTPGMTGADIAYLFNEAALETGRRGGTSIRSSDIDTALATVMLGRSRPSILPTAHDRQVTAWHEAGHAVAALTQAAADDPVSVTIIPRGSAGGVTWMGGSDDLLLTRTKALAQLTIALAGRAAEEALLDGDCTMGAQSDLAAATNLATTMVTQFGMGPTGNLRFVQPEHVHGISRQVLDEQVEMLLGQALRSARALAQEHSALLAAVATALLEVETLSLADLRQLQHTVEGEPAQSRPLAAEVQVALRQPSPQDVSRELGVAAVRTVPPSRT